MDVESGATGDGRCARSLPETTFDFGPWLLDAN